jgi:hypothetical protein
MPMTSGGKGMRKVFDSLPSVKQILITMAVCLALGMAVAGFHPKALIALAMGVLVLAMVTLRNYNPMAWEAYNDPLAHSMRLQRDKAAEQLRSIVHAHDLGDTTALSLEMDHARQLVHEMYSPKGRR